MIYAGKASVIVGGQFGSESKGLAAAWLATHHDPSLFNRVVCTTNAGAQAGHTSILADGTKFVCYHLPTLGVLLPKSTIYLNAGSIIDLELLGREIRDVADALGIERQSIISRLVVHPNAAVIWSRHKDAESNTGASDTRRIGSTSKGVGAALADKIMRQPLSTIGSLPYPERAGFGFQVKALDLQANMDEGVALTVEIPQGTGLSLNNSQFFPHCTSRDAWVMQGLTDAGIHASYLAETLMVCRTFPIRVGHVYNNDSDKIGDSGPFYPDSVELSWRQFRDVQPEITTVTKRVRRIATWSANQYLDALRLNRPTFMMLTFMNYIPRFLGTGDHSTDIKLFVAWLRQVERRVGISPTHLYSWGPRTCDVSFNLEQAIHNAEHEHAEVPF